MGFRALRFDFAKGYGANWVKEYIEATRPHLAIGEVWTDCKWNGTELDYDQASSKAATLACTALASRPSCWSQGGISSSSSSSAQHVALVGCVFMDVLAAAQWLLTQCRPAAEARLAGLRMLTVRRLWTGLMGRTALLLRSTSPPRPSCR